jgi:hypothetical protein
MKGNDRLLKILIPGLALAVGISVLAPRRAEAGPVWIIKQNETHGQWTLGPTASLMPMYFAPGLRLGIPVAKSGFLPMINDEVRIEIGATFQMWWHPAWHDQYCYWCDPHHYNDRKCYECEHADYVGHLFFRLGFPVMLHWAFYLTKMWSVYAGFGFELGVPLDDYYRDHYIFGPDGWIWIALAFGTRIHVAKWCALRFEIGTLGLLTFGVDFMFGGS